MVRCFQLGILERRTRTDLFAVHAKTYSKLWKRVKGCTIPILADTWACASRYAPRGHASHGHLAGVYFMGLHLMGIRLMGVYFICLHLMGMRLMGMRLMDVHLMDVAGAVLSGLWGISNAPDLYSRWRYF